MKKALVFLILLLSGGTMMSSCTDAFGEFDSIRSSEYELGHSIFGKDKSNSLLEEDDCLLDANFTLTLKDGSGNVVTTVDPATTYTIEVQGPSTSLTNVGYCFTNRVRCTTPASCKDTNFSTHMVIFTITTAAMATGSGISFTIAPTDCTGNVSDPDVYGNGLSPHWNP